MCLCCCVFAGMCLCWIANLLDCVSAELCLCSCVSAGTSLLLCLGVVSLLACVFAGMCLCWIVSLQQYCLFVCV